jgi:glycosyltransferase involved in cell wall biosynthesis
LAPILPLGLPKLQSYQRAIPWAGVARASWLAGRSLVFTACSASLQASAPEAGTGRWHTVFNPVDTDRFAPAAQVAADAPLMFLGRLEAIKGVHDAIAIARAARRRLLIAGNRVTGEQGEAYFATAIAPAIDGHEVQYIGEVDDVEKARWLRQAAALLMPIHWEEPFGIVMAEALACGTPVIGYRRGSVPEVVRHGVTGFVCDDQAAAVAAVARLDELHRPACRADAETRFGVAPIVDAYERIYAELRR